MTDYRIKWHVEVLEKLVVDFGPSPVRECLRQILEEKRAVLDGTGVVVEALTDPTEDAAPPSPRLPKPLLRLPSTEVIAPFETVCPRAVEKSGGAFGRPRRPSHAARRPRRGP